MAEANHVSRACITFVFFTFINIEVSKSIDFKNIQTLRGGNCRFIKEEDYGIDLSPLENYEETSAKYIAYADNRVVYFYHPCSDVPLPASIWTECKDGYSLCFFLAQNQTDKNLDVNSVLKYQVPGQFYRIAHARDAEFQISGNETHLVYKTSNTTATINLLCNSASDGKSTLSVKDPQRNSGANFDVTNHTLILNSPYSCYRKLSNEKHHMSGWGVFFIILTTIAAAYFFGGMLVLKHVKGATGTEMIPNYNFWVSLPGRIKYFFLRLIGRGSQGPDSYESI